MEAAIAILALMFVAFVVLGVYLTVKAVGAAKRGVERTVTQARKAVEDTTLRAKSMGQVGVAGELAQLRLTLRTSMRATQDSLRARVEQDESLKESLRLFERLSGHGHELDDELKRLEREPDKQRIAERMPELRERTERITHAADSLRWAARDRARQFADDDLASLSAEIEVESGALRDWATKGPTTSAAPGTAARPADAPGANGSPAASWPESATVADAPQAIGAAGPAPVYPWQKTARPETTN
ncbi:hypothetical protein [Streptomyces sp. CBMA152]|uniref:hypothetical protein n=1 Tax=Streptomyces sp. CBMA152 TaxID=1896312 RepID=UPI001661422F|nr:hypothetical protein [Streptomyces sp. CBMA152]MBD0747268.1 hypothetical protein [Streptomyces sp. CBMA152]